MTQTTQEAAPPPTNARAARELERYLTFTLRGEVYALDILDVTEIIEYRALTVVPMMPNFIRGVINLRGRVLPVVDLAARFELGATEVGKRTGIIVVEPTDRDGSSTNVPGVGIVVDAVNKVLHLGAQDIEPPPAFGTGIRADFIRGMAKIDGDFVIVLDLLQVLSVEDMSRHLSAASLAVNAESTIADETADHTTT